MSSRHTPHIWEVWLAYLRFLDYPEIGKVRPVVIIDDDAVATVVAKVTTSEPHDDFSYCELQDWKREGLDRPSRVQIAPLFNLSDSDFLNDEPIGVLTRRDRQTLALSLDPR